MIGFGSEVEAGDEVAVTVISCLWKRETRVRGLRVLVGALMSCGASRAARWLMVAETKVLSSCGTPRGIAQCARGAMITISELGLWNSL